MADKQGTIFDSNVRRFLGQRGAVNSDIIRTCTDTKTSHQFWFLNNGLTILCDSFDAVADPDKPHVKIKNMQIVNGCQTATALSIAESEGKLAADTRVLLRVYETSDKELLNKLVLTTNNQNRISSRDLRSNDSVQIDMEQGFAKYGRLYERKPRQYDNVKEKDKIVVANEIVGQAYLAIVLRKPGDARRRKYKVWGELYDSIFSGKAIESYVLAESIYRATNAWLKKAGLTTIADDVKRKIANNGAFHIARTAAFLWRGDDKFDIAVDKLQEQIIEADASGKLDAYFEKAFGLIEQTVKAEERYLLDIDSALKSATFEGEIDKKLYKKDS